ncbi:MAG: DNA/RNA nuclease SfsA [Aquificaceae bacterium]|nr:DNA/RNA nuclease SfsA [Aquificaceae bacterium]
MRFPELIKAKFLKRINRFVGLVELRGETHTAYVRNTGRMAELLSQGNTVYVSQKKDGKLGFEVVLAEYGSHLVCIDSSIAPKLYSEFINAPVRYEPSFGKVRFDLLWNGRPVEVKSVNLVRERIAMFPDAPTLRGKRHVEKLMELSREGYRPLIVFVVQREDCDAFSPNWELDRDFSDALLSYANLNLEIKAYRCSVSLEEIKIKDEIPVKLEVFR